MNYIDIIIIAILLIFIIVGVCRGFIFSLLSVFGGIINIYLATLLTKPMTSLTSTIGLNSAITNAYAQKMQAFSGFNENLVGKTAEQLQAHIKSSIDGSSLSGITKTLTNWFLKISPENLQGKTSVTLTDILSKAFASFWCVLIAFIVSLVIVYLVLWVITLIANKLKQIKPINATDKILGVLFGAVKGSLIVCLIFAVLSLFNQTGIMGDVVSAIQSSKIGGWSYHYVYDFVHNYLLAIIKQ